jgi:type I restriction-modification system DNA methylase subunit
MSKAKEKLSEAERSEIVKNILNAKDKRLQLKIEADLHLTSVTTIKEILKERGFSLRILNGGNGKKKHIEDEIITPVEEIKAVEEQAEPDEIGQAWADLSIPPDVGLTPLTAEPLPPLSNEERVCEPIPAEQAEKIPYTKPEIIEPPLPKSSTSEETAADSIDIDLSYQRFKKLIREKMHCENRLEEIKAELQLYRDTCNCILLDLKSGGMEA